MKVINARNVNDAYIKGLRLLHKYGKIEESRAGHVLVAPFPVTTVYQRPYERILFDAKRDANPFFHLMESLWMLAGRNDATWLDKFVKDFSSRFAEESGHQHGAYGYRWRTHFMLDGTEDTYEHGFELDQLDRIVYLLRKNPRDRRIVLQMWDPEIDLGANKRDVPCNLCVLPRIVNNALDITVVCRSNDAIWGAYGANAVHFSVLQEYLAARLNVQIGTYYQISNNFHAYLEVLNKKIPDPEVLKQKHIPDPYKGGKSVRFKVTPTQIVTQPEYFDEDLRHFFSDPDAPPLDGYHNNFFVHIAVPMFYAYHHWKEGRKAKAYEELRHLPTNSDWWHAAAQWFYKRNPEQANKVEASNV